MYVPSAEKQSRAVGIVRGNNSEKSKGLGASSTFRVSLYLYGERPPDHCFPLVLRLGILQDLHGTSGVQLTRIILCRLVASDK